MALSSVGRMFFERIALLLLCLISLSNVNGETKVDIAHPCNVAMFSQRQTVYNIDHDCPNGTIIWHYPESTIQLVFTPLTPRNRYEACIGHIASKSIRQIVETIKNKQEILPIPKQGEEVCSGPTTDTVIMKIVGPEKKETYTGYIPYFVYDFK